MASLIEAITSTLGTAIQVVINLVSGLLALLAYIPMAMQVTTTTIGLLPTQLAGFGAALIAVSVAYLIIGR